MHAGGQILLVSLQYISILLTEIYTSPLKLFEDSQIYVLYFVYQYSQDKDPQPVDCTGKFKYPVPGTFPYKTSTPSTPGACTYDGTFQLIPQGRDSCFEGSTNEYVVYYGGGSDQCASKKVFLRQAGKFQAPRSQWGLSEAESGTNTTILSVGRNCTNDELTGLSSSGTASDVSVFLAGTNTRWTISPVGEDCSLVNIIDKVRTHSYFEFPYL